MPETDSARLESTLDAYIDAQEAERRTHLIPALATAYAERLQWLTLLDGFAFSMRVGDRDAELSFHAGTVLGKRGP